MSRTRPASTPTPMWLIVFAVATAAVMLFAALHGGDWLDWSGVTFGGLVAIVGSFDRRHYAVTRRRAAEAMARKRISADQDV